MATKVLDQEKVVELLKRYRPLLKINKAAGGTMSLTFTCPFHNDINPSFAYNINYDQGFCHACKQTGKLTRIIASLEHISEDEARKIDESCRKVVKEEKAASRTKNIDISIAQVEEWHKAVETDTKLRVLFTRWGWKQEVLEKYRLGISEGRVSIPMFEHDTLVGLKFYSPGAKMKYQNADGTPQLCWPLANLEQDTVFLVEGEKDCITMNAAGFNAITFTTGAGGVAMPYIRFFAGKTIYIIYDIDEAGRKGAVKVAMTLHHAARKIYIVDLPLEGVPKGDLTDAYERDATGFVDFINELVSHTTEYVPPAAVSRVTVPLEVVKTYLEDIVTNKLFYRRVNIKVRVVNNAQHETTIIPKDVHVTCNRDFKDSLCNQCPMFFKEEGMPLYIKPEYPELMSMVGNNVKVQRSAIQSMAQIIEGCPKFRVEQKSFQSLYPIVIIPAIEANKKSHSYSMVTAWALDVPSKENVDYDVEGVVLANPETQKLELICYRMTEDAESIDSFELTDEMIERLKIFQCNHHPSTVLEPS